MNRRNFIPRAGLQALGLSIAPAALLAGTGVPRSRVLRVSHLTATCLVVRYRCNGAVGGGWCKGKLPEFGPTYVLLDPYPDGSVESQQVAYGPPVPAPEPA